MSSMPIDNAEGEMPLRLGPAADFARIREFLPAAGYDNATIFRALNVDAAHDLSRIDPARCDLSPCAPPLALLIKLFVLLQFVPTEEAESALGAATLDSFLALGLLRQNGDHSRRCGTSVLLHPVGDLLIVSDRLTRPDGSPVAAALPDAVLPAAFVGTLRFLDLITNYDAEDVLDLCSGSGVAALALSPRAARVVSADITERATLFAEFNRRLNNRENVEVVRGDLYGPVEGRTFDFIVAHPPYVPAARDAVIYRDGGATGEALVQRIVEELPRHLRPGGMFLNTSYGIDTEDASFEQRARRWLGAAGEEFDVIFATQNEMSPREAVEAVRQADPQIAAAELAQIEQAFADIRAVQRSYGGLAIRRRRDCRPARPAWTARARLSEKTDAASFARAFRWHEIGGAPDFAETFRGLKPRLAPDLAVKVTYRVAGGELAPSAYVLETERPFDINSKVDPEMMAVLAHCRGAETAEQIYRALREAAIIPARLSFADFSAFVAAMIERGYLTIDELEAETP
ncbi:MAG TPA: methyltransferase [Pyrinomonadaceae bacterium]|nr:methyltransferase [Pyrinomonadaceae bacterium]